MNKAKLLVWSLIIGLAVITISLYPSLPASIPSHWNLKGEVDSYGNKNTVFIFLAVAIILMIFMDFVQKKIFKKGDLGDSKNVYQIIEYTIIIYLLSIQVLILILAKGIKLNASQIILLGLGVVFIIIGNYNSRIKQNKFFGVRTSWTLSNKHIWRKTQLLGGYVLVLTGIIILLSSFFNNWVGFIILGVSVIVIVLTTTVYSYRLVKIEKAKEDKS